MTMKLLEHFQAQSDSKSSALERAIRYIVTMHCDYDEWSSLSCTSLNDLRYLLSMSTTNTENLNMRTLFDLALSSSTSPNLDVIRVLLDHYRRDLDSADYLFFIDRAVISAEYPSIQVIQLIHEYFSDEHKIMPPSEITRFLENHKETLRRGSEDDDVGEPYSMIPKLRFDAIQNIRYLVSSCGQHEPRHAVGWMYFACEQSMEPLAVKLLCQSQLPVHYVLQHGGAISYGIYQFIRVATMFKHHLFRPDPNDHQRLPLHLACAKKHSRYQSLSLQLLQFLFKRYREAISIPDSNGDLPLHIACRNGISVEAVAYLTRCYKQAMLALNNNGETPFNLLLQNKGLDLNVYDLPSTYSKSEFILPHLCAQLGILLQVCKELHSYSWREAGLLVGLVDAFYNPY